MSWSLIRLHIPIGVWSSSYLFTPRYSGTWIPMLESQRVDLPQFSSESSWPGFVPRLCCTSSIELPVRLFIDIAFIYSLKIYGYWDYSSWGRFRYHSKYYAFFIKNSDLKPSLTSHRIVYSKDLSTNDKCIVYPKWSPTPTDIAHQLWRSQVILTRSEDLYEPSYWPNRNTPTGQTSTPNHPTSPFIWQFINSDFVGKSGLQVDHSFLSRPEASITDQKYQLTIALRCPDENQCAISREAYIFQTLSPTRRRTVI